MKLIVYVHEKYGEPSIVIDAPTPDELIKNMQLLDGNKYIGLQVVSPIGRLFVNASVEGRMMTVFSNGQGRSGYLVDKSQTGDRWITFVWENRQADDRPNSETTSKQVAEEVALYFLQHQGFSPEHPWEGNIFPAEK